MITIGLRDIDNAPDFNAIMTEECAKRGLRFPLVPDEPATDETNAVLIAALTASIERVKPGCFIIEDDTTPEPSKT